MMRPLGISWLAGAARADILPPMPQGFVAEVPPPPDLPPHPLPLGLVAVVLALLAGGTLAGVYLRRRKSPRTLEDARGE